MDYMPGPVQLPFKIETIMVDVNIPGALFKVDSFEYLFFFNFLAETYSHIKFFALTDN